MKLVKGMWLTDEEEHFLEFTKEPYLNMVDGKFTYQFHKYKKAIQYVQNFRRAIDIGAHVGFMTRYMMWMFEHIEAFEPIEAHRECWLRNTLSESGHESATLHPYALGAAPGMVSFNIDPKSTGGTHVAIGEPGTIEMRTLDSFAFEDVDFIKVDCEGFEVYIMQGAEQTLLRNKPAVMIEQKPSFGDKFDIKDTEGLEYLKSLGMVVMGDNMGDYFLSWEE